MEFVDRAQLGDEHWDALCTSALGAWFWNTSAWRNYILAYRPALESRSLDFAVVDSGRPVALVSLMLERSADEADVRFSFGGEPCWSPALVPGADPRREAVALREALRRIDELAEIHGATSVALKASPLAKEFERYLPTLLAATTRAGYSDASLCSQLIALDSPVETLRSAMTRGHRADITRGNRLLTVTVLDQSTITADAFSAYQEMHRLAAGRVTRPPATFALMESWISEGRAALLQATKGDQPVGFAYLLLHGDGAYYASAANDPRHDRDPIGHVLHAAAIDWLRATGVRRYELGLQQFGPLPHDNPGAKDLSIARFKRGFGGRTLPLVIRRKWFSEAAFRRDTQASADGYAEATWRSSPGRS